MGKETQQVNSERCRQRYSREFKLAAVKLLQAGSKPATQIALELGIRRNLLYKWAEALNRHGGNTENAFQGPGRNKLGKSHDPLRAENARLKRELIRANRELDILKKAQAYFAKAPR